jgi:hypothetical protein
MDDSYTAFISYSHADRAFADIVYDLLLKQLKVNVWRDEDVPIAGQDLDRELPDALYHCRFVVYIASPDAKKSEWVKSELRHAIDNQIPIFMLLVRGDKKSAVPFSLNQRVYIDATDKKLLAGLQTLLKNIYERFERHLLHKPLCAAKDLLNVETGAEERAAFYRIQGNNAVGNLVVQGECGVTLRTFMDAKYQIGQGIVGRVWGKKDADLVDWVELQDKDDFRQEYSMNKSQKKAMQNLRTILCLPIFRHGYLRPDETAENGAQAFDTVTGVLTIDSSLSLDKLGLENKHSRLQLIEDGLEIANQLAIWLDIDDGTFPDEIIEKLMRQHLTSS